MLKGFFQLRLPFETTDPIHGIHKYTEYSLDNGLQVIPKMPCGAQRHTISKAEAPTPISIIYIHSPSSVRVLFDRQCFNH